MAKHMPTPENNLHVPDDLLAQLTAEAAAEGRSVEEVAAESLRAGLRAKSWQDLLARGRQRGAASGITEDQVPDVVREYRSEHRGR
jgi:plasmid stability protein